ncbi:putative lipoprotein [Deinococcus sp. HSC-46F16]|uniref:YbaY family lipoprotein n=1 Tax=Deinococcus sp. HSC-46F16 TaxID=2910968 RepID=UPI00209FE443|nr:YbaY family lipoprotein [Deinococcus sp. HSC-46F16]MCP2015953.1 putative lipoprotein [Deinococcus sp. HSC-46F16]
MKRTLPLLLAALLASPALAQGIRIVRPSTPPPATTASTPDLSDVPAGWRVVAGRVSAPSTVRLPAGSTVTVAIQDVTGGRSPSTLLEVSFPTTKLSTPYQLQYNPVRINPRREYVVTARVNDARGRLLYRSVTRQDLPESRTAVLNLRVTPR